MSKSELALSVLDPIQWALLDEELDSVVHVVVKDFLAIGYVLLIRLVIVLLFQLAHVEVEALVVPNCFLEVFRTVDRELLHLAVDFPLQRQVVSFDVGARLAWGRALRRGQLEFVCGCLSGAFTAHRLAFVSRARLAQSVACDHST